MKSDLSIISAAANNAAIAAKNASDAAASASQNASIAAKAAAESATAIAVVATDTTWMKGTLTRVEETINEMNKAFVTATQHNEVLKILADHEVRLNSNETEKIRTTVLLTIGTAILSLILSLLIWHLLGK